MGIPLRQQMKVGAYVLKQHMLGRKRYPLVLMLEPLFRCNLACAGCGKIDYPDAILNKRLSVEECLDAVDQCGAPVVAIAGGEPLLHKEMPEIVEKILARGKIIILCTNALLLEKRIGQYKPHPRFTWDIHLDGDKDQLDWAVSQAGVYDRAVAALKDAKARGFRVAITPRCSTTPSPSAWRSSSTASPDGRRRHHGLARLMPMSGAGPAALPQPPEDEGAVPRHLARGREGWKMGNSPLFLDFLAGNQTYNCTPWGNPTRNIFGWQRPCYLLGEGYAKSSRS
jgi:MoaA/NifB/PqqE/SkfB family radical SAM enzyme